jgi:hypothetical protein
VSLSLNERITYYILLKVKVKEKNKAIPVTGCGGL